MLRGAKKNMIVVRTRDSRMFEEAYFVMRRDAGQTDADELDMLWEANRILENTLPHPRREPSVPDVPGRRTRMLQRLIWFCMGVLCGGGTAGLLWWIL